MNGVKSNNFKGVFRPSSEIGLYSTSTPNYTNPDSTTRPSRETSTTNLSLRAFKTRNKSCYDLRFLGNNMSEYADEIVTSDNMSQEKDSSVACLLARFKNGVRNDHTHSMGSSTFIKDGFTDQVKVV